MELKTYRARHDARSSGRWCAASWAQTPPCWARAKCAVGRHAALADRGDAAIEVTASAEVVVPSRLPPRAAPAAELRPPRFSARRRHRPGGPLPGERRRPSELRQILAAEDFGAVRGPPGRPRRRCPTRCSAAVYGPDRCRNVRKIWPANWSSGDAAELTSGRDRATAKQPERSAGGHGRKPTCSSPARSSPARPAASGGPGRADGSRQDHHHRQAGRPFPAARAAQGGADHGRHLSHRRGRTVAHLCRDHRSADGGRLRRPTKCARPWPGWPISTWC